MYKILYILIFSILLFSGAESEKLDSTNSRKQDPIRLAIVLIGDKLGYINQVGEIVIKPQFDAAEPFSEGWAFVHIGISKSGSINREGKFFRGVNYFSEGLSPVLIGGKYGYINQVGEIVIEPQFGVAGHFSEGLSPVKIGGKYGYINQVGEIVIKPQFDDAGIFLK